MRVLGTVLALSMLFSVWGCDDDTITVPEVKSSVARHEPSVSDEEIRDGVQQNNDFAMRLFRRLVGGAGDSNVVFSPYSISSVMAMVWAGARGETEAQIAAVMGFSHDASTLDVFNALDRRYDEGTTEFTITSVNEVWAQDGWHFLQEYLDTLARYFGAGIKLADFASHPDKWRRTINDWVEQETHGRIKDLLPAGSVDSLTRMVLVNAIYFYGRWLNEFDHDDTVPGTFHTPGGDVECDFMVGNFMLDATASDGWVAVELKYRRDEYGMLIIMPSAGRMDDLMASLDATFLDGVAASLEEGDVHIEMPKFEFTTSVNGKGVLEAMGIRDLFSIDDADLSGIDGKRDLYVSGLFHKAYVRVDEEGTEAAAATGAIVGAGAGPEYPHEIILDHPFLFFIRDRVTGQILFMGRVMDPTAG